MILRLALICVFGCQLCACASSEGAEFSGESGASEKLRDDTMALMGPVAVAKLGCERIETVETSILDVSGKIEGNSAGTMTSGSTEERWVIAGCGAKAAVIVTFTPDGQGGSYISVRTE